MQVLDETIGISKRHSIVAILFAAHHAIKFKLYEFASSDERVGDSGQSLLNRSIDSQYLIVLRPDDVALLPSTKAPRMT